MMEELDGNVNLGFVVESNELFTCEYCPGFWTSNLSRLNKHKKSKSHQKMKFDSEATNISDFDDNINKVSEVNDASNISKNNEIESNELFTCEYCPGFWTSNLSRFNKHKKSKSHKKMEFNSEKATKINDLETDKNDKEEENLPDLINEDSNNCKNNKIQSNNELLTCEYCPGFWTCNLSRLNKHNKTKSHLKMKSISEATEEMIDFHKFESDIDISTRVKQEIILDEDDESTNFNLESNNDITNYCLKEEKIDIKEEELENILEDDEDHNRSNKSITRYLPTKPNQDHMPREFSQSDTFG